MFKLSGFNCNTVLLNTFALAVAFFVCSYYALLVIGYFLILIPFLTVEDSLRTVVIDPRSLILNYIPQPFTQLTALVVILPTLSIGYRERESCLLTALCFKNLIARFSEQNGFSN